MRSVVGAIFPLACRLRAEGIPHRADGTAELTGVNAPILIIFCPGLAVERRLSSKTPGWAVIEPTGEIFDAEELENV